MDIDNILHTPIRTLELSEAFQEGSTNMGFITMQQILDTGTEALFSRKGFNYTWLEELTGWLMKYGLLHLLQPAGGKNHE